MSGVIGGAYWVVVSPPHARTGRRFIADWTVAALRRYALQRFLRDYTLHTWAYYRKQGWTVERVFISPVITAPSE